MLEFDALFRMPRLFFELAIEGECSGPQLPAAFEAPEVAPPWVEILCAGEQTAIWRRNRRDIENAALEEQKP